jgi:predicted permease
MSPMIFATCASVGCSTISSMSLEKSNLQTLRTLPISMGKILLSKCLVNILLGVFFVVVNGTIAWCYLELDKWSIMFCYLIPFIAVIFISLTGILLDYRFIEKNETEDNAILSQRLITVVPTFVSLIIGVAPVFVPVYKKFALLLGAYSVILVLAIVIELLYLLINRKKLISHLFM